jgi:hypothetical protein
LRLPFRLPFFLAPRGAGSTVVPVAYVSWFSMGMLSKGLVGGPVTFALIISFMISSYKFEIFFASILDFCINVFRIGVDMSEDELRLNYENRYRDFTNDISPLTLMKKLTRVPSEKSYWALELSKAERQLRSLEIKKKRLIRDLSNKLNEKSPITLHKGTLNKIEESDNVEELTTVIDDVKMTIKQLERIYDCVKFVAKDFENILKFIQLQDG